MHGLTGKKIENIPEYYNHYNNNFLNNSSCETNKQNVTLIVIWFSRFLYYNKDGRIQGDQNTVILNLTLLIRNRIIFSIYCNFMDVEKQILWSACIAK